LSRNFKGGVHPPENKELTKDKPIEQFESVPGYVYIPLQMHAGKPAVPVVGEGDEVKTGQLIARAQDGISANVHSSVTGRVVAIEKKKPLPNGAKGDWLVIEAQQEDEWELLPEIDWKEATPAELKERAFEAGIVGMGGAAFPTHIKLSPPKPVDTFILNAAECEPFLTCDYRLLVEKPRQVLEGMMALMKAVGVQKGFIGIESNKADVVRTLEREIAAIPYGDIKVKILPTRYPQGSEKQLIYAITGRKVPLGGLPHDVGVLVNNVGTAYAFYQSLKFGKPLVERVITVSGKVSKPGNYRVRIGTSFRFVLEQVGYVVEEGRVVAGGPMMGVAQSTLDVPVVKGTSGIILLGKEDFYVPSSMTEFNCIRCSRCVDVCPMNLVPTTIAFYAVRRKFEDAKKWGAMACIECGSCAYACPAKLPLVQAIRYAKQVIRVMR